MFAAAATEDDGIGNSITSEAVKAVYAPVTSPAAYSPGIGDFGCPAPRFPA